MTQTTELDVREQEAPLARPLEAELLNKVIIEGDLSRLTPEERLRYYGAVCEITGLTAAMRPFEYIKLNNRLVLYARKEATDQLRMKHGVSVVALEPELIANAIYRVTVTVRNAKGRTDMATGAVGVKGLGAEGFANAVMKAETKAKRRATLSICGLGMLDESEIESIPEAEVGEPAAEPRQSTRQAIADFFANGQPGPKAPPETAPKGNGDGRKAVMEAVQFLSDRDCNGWQVSMAEAGDVFKSAQRLSGLHQHDEVAQWLREQGQLGLVEDGGTVQGLSISKKKTTA